MLKGLTWPLALGLLVRELIAPWTGHPFDFEIWVRLGWFMQTWANPYTLLPYVPGLSFNPIPMITSISYPPLAAFIFGGAYWLYSVLGAQSAFVYYFILKQPMMISDLLVPVLLYKLAALREDADSAQRVAKIWLLFPFSIIVSSMWGALDPIALMLLLASLHAAETNRPYLSAVMLGFASFLKLMPIIFIPVFLIRSRLSFRQRSAFLLISAGIPVVGTAVPFLALDWNFSGIMSAVAYQGSLPGFGGMGIFNAFSLLMLPGSLATLLSWAWIPALLIAYGYIFLRKLPISESLIITVLVFSITRAVMPEQWALYPIALLLLVKGGSDRDHLKWLSVVATGYLLVNNLLLVRFFAPIYPSALSWDTYVDNLSSVAELRYAILLVLSTLFSAEAISVVIRSHSFVRSKLVALATIRRREVLSSLGYASVVSIAGGLLDYTATNMVTDWAKAIQSNVFLGLSWLSFYHIMLVLTFEVSVILIIAFAGRSLEASISLFLRLTFLNVGASAISLLLYRAIEGAPLLAGIPIYLVGSAFVSERSFVVFALTLSFLGLFYLKEMRRFLVGSMRWLYLGATIRSRGIKVADSLSPPP